MSQQLPKEFRALGPDAKRDEPIIHRVKHRNDRTGIARNRLRFTCKNGVNENWERKRRSREFSAENQACGRNLSGFGRLPLSLIPIWLSSDLVATQEGISPTCLQLISSTHVHKLVRRRRTKNCKCGRIEAIDHPSRPNHC